QIFSESGWRQRSPSRAASGLVAATYANDGASADLIALGAATSLTGNGPAPEQLLAVDRTAVFTYPDRTQNRLFMLVARGERPVFESGRLSGAAYFREN